MPIYIHFANLIIDKSAIEQKYEGGIDQFRVDHEIDGQNENQEDGELIALASMDIQDFDLAFLAAKGLHFDEISQFSTDFTILSRYGAYLWPTAWITDNQIFAWHKDASPESIKKANAISKLSAENFYNAIQNGENPCATIL